MQIVPEEPLGGDLSSLPHGAANTRNAAPLPEVEAERTQPVEKRPIRALEVISFDWNPRETRPPYPASIRESTTELMHGTEIPVPYRWLEDTTTDGVRQWARAQNDLTRGFLDSHPARRLVEACVTGCGSGGSMSVPVWKGPWEYFTRTTDRREVFRRPREGGDATVVLDERDLWPDRLRSLSGVSVSPDGRLIAYASSARGSDLQEWHIRDAESGREEHPTLSGLRGATIAWLPDCSGFVYASFGPGDNQAIFVHRLNERHRTDRMLFELPEERGVTFALDLTHDGGGLVVSASAGASLDTRVFLFPVAELRPGAAPSPIELFKGIAASFTFAGSFEQSLYFVTDLDAPRGRIIAFEHGSVREAVAEGRRTIQSAIQVGSGLVLAELDFGSTTLSYVPLESLGTGNTIRSEIPIPPLGTVGNIKRLPNGEGVRFSFSSFTHPATVYRYEFETSELSIDFQERADFEPQGIQVRRTSYTSRDGTSIPMLLVSSERSGVDSPPRPAYLYGYGGFDVSLTPRFSTGLLTWLSLGGVVALPCIRGGGELGRHWHESARGERKQRSFEDFIAAAEHLVERGITRPDRLVAAGSSHGGLVVGAAVTERPELFAAALPTAGVFDMLRFDRFPPGWAWTEEFGSPARADDFARLLAYSPLHRIRDGTRYPAMMITTAFEDPSVHSSHSFKFAAAIQAGSEGGLALLRVSAPRGHHCGDLVFEQRPRDSVDQLLFLIEVLSLDTRGLERRTA